MNYKCIIQKGTFHCQRQTMDKGYSDFSWNPQREYMLYNPKTQSRSLCRQPSAGIILILGVPIPSPPASQPLSFLRSIGARAPFPVIVLCTEFLISRFRKASSLSANNAWYRRKVRKYNTNITASITAARMVMAQVAVNSQLTSNMEGTSRLQISW